MDPQPFFTFPRRANRAAILVLLAAGAVGLPVYAGILLGYGANPTTFNVGYHPRNRSAIAMPCMLDARDRLPLLSYHGREGRHGRLAADRRVHELPQGDLARLWASSARSAGVRRRNAHPLDQGSLTWPIMSISTTGPMLPWAWAASSATARSSRWRLSESAKPLNMAWCLECHRSPEPYLRPPIK